MDLGDVKEAAGFDEMSRDLSPSVEVRQPTEHAAGRVHDVELSVEIVREVIDVGLNETRTQADILREGAGLGDRRGGEIDAGDARAQAGPAQGVEAEVALQVKQILSVDRSDLPHLVRAKLVQTRLEVGDPIEVGPVVDAGPLVPERAIGLEVLLHGLPACDRRN